MKEIKFRIWDNKEQMMIDYEQIKKMRAKTIKDILFNHEKREITIMFYTGLKDKYGTEIYDGDIILIPIGNKEQIATINYDKGSFMLNWIYGGISIISLWLNEIRDSIILGNIFEDSNILKKAYEDYKIRGK